jgi:hypothetical protein
MAKLIYLLWPRRSLTTSLTTLAPALSWLEEPSFAQSLAAAIARGG